MKKQIIVAMILVSVFFIPARSNSSDMLLPDCQEGEIITIADNFSPDFRRDEFVGSLTVQALSNALLSDGYHPEGPMWSEKTQSTPGTIEWLNDILKTIVLYNKITRHGKHSVSSLAQFMILHVHNSKFKETMDENDLKKLNRLLIEDYYHRVTPKSPKKCGPIILAAEEIVGCPSGYLLEASDERRTGSVQFGYNNYLRCLAKNPGMAEYIKPNTKKPKN